MTENFPGTMFNEAYKILIRVLARKHRCILSRVVLTNEVNLDGYYEYQCRMAQQRNHNSQAARPHG